MSERIGKLRHLLTIEREIRSGDGGGGALTDWEAVAEVWGAIEAVSGKESVRADRLSGELAYQITIRGRSDLAPAMRIRKGNDIYRIVAILDKDGRGRFLHCHCERVDL